MCKRNNVEFIHEEHHKVLNRETKDTTIKKHRHNLEISSQSVPVLLCGWLHAVAFVSVSLGLLHSNTPLTTTTPPAPHFFQTNVHKQHKTNHQRGWKKTHAAVLALMLPGNQTKVIL